MRGDGFVQCCICGGFHLDPYPNLAVDLNGDRWDVCKGQCAEDAGIIEQPPDSWFAEHLEELGPLHPVTDEPGTIEIPDPAPVEEPRIA